MDADQNPIGAVAAQGSTAASAAPAPTVTSAPRSRAYRCPGQDYAISAAVHWGRLQAGYAACRECEHRQSRPQQTHKRGDRPTTRKLHVDEPLFYPEGVGGTALNRFTPQVARQMACAIAGQLHESCSERSSPRVMFGQDGRWHAPDQVAAVIEGLRWGGAEVFDLGPTTSAELLATLAEQQAGGAVLIANPPGARETVGLAIWDAQGIAWSQGGRLDALEQAYRAGTDRTSRRAAAAQHGRPAADYLRALEARAACLRPLRLVLAAESDVFAMQLHRLLALSGCTLHRLPDSAQALVPDPAWQAACRGGLPLAEETRRLNRLIAAVRGQQADLGAAVRADGEQLTVVDGAGRVVPGCELLTLLVAVVRKQHAAATVVVDERVGAEWLRRWSTPAGQLRTAPARRESMARLLVECQAELGGSPSGDFWFPVHGSAPRVYAADALAALLRVLAAISHPHQSLAQAIAHSLNLRPRRRV